MGQGVRVGRDSGGVVMQQEASKQRRGIREMPLLQGCLIVTVTARKRNRQGPQAEAAGPAGTGPSPRVNAPHDRACLLGVGIGLHGPAAVAAVAAAALQMH